jgi:hypothetical protein
VQSQESEASAKKRNDEEIQQQKDELAKREKEQEVMKMNIDKMAD